MAVRPLDLVVSISKHQQERVFHGGEGGDIAEVHGVKSRSLYGLAHDPADEIAEHQLREGLFEDSRRGMGTQILNVQGVLPFAVDGLQLPATMVEIDEVCS